MAQEIVGDNGHIRAIAKRTLKQMGQPRILFDGNDLAETLCELSGDHALAGTNFIDRTVISEVETVEEIGDYVGVSQKVLRQQDTFAGPGWHGGFLSRCGLEAGTKKPQSQMAHATECEARS
jgi:hypothetical protein